MKRDKGTRRYVNINIPNNFEAPVLKKAIYPRSLPSFPQPFVILSLFCFSFFIVLAPLKPSIAGQPFVSSATPTITPSYTATPMITPSYTPTPTLCISVTPNRFSFTAFVGAHYQIEQTLELTNCGTSGFWSSTISPPVSTKWLFTSISNGNLKTGTAQSITLKLQFINLLAGNYYATITYNRGLFTRTVTVALAMVFPEGYTFYTQPGHGMSLVYGIAWSPNGKYIALADSDGTAQVLDAATGGNVITYTGHSAAVYAVAWSPNGQYIVSAGTDSVQVWDAATKSTKYTLPLPSSTLVNDVAWSPNGQYIALVGSRGSDGTVGVMDAATGTKKYYQPLLGSNSVNSVAWSPDSKHIALASSDGTVHVWDATTGGNIITYTGPSSAVMAVAWSPNGQYIASGYSDGTVRVLDPAAGGRKVNYIYGHNNGNDVIYAAAWSPDSSRIASGGGKMPLFFYSGDSIVQVWEAP